MYIILKTLKGKSQRSRATHSHEVSFPICHTRPPGHLHPLTRSSHPTPGAAAIFLFRHFYKFFWGFHIKDFDHIHPHSQICTCSSYPNLPLTSCLFLKNKPIKHQNPNCIKVKKDSTRKSHSVTSKPDLLILRNFWIIMSFKIKQHFNLRYPKKRSMYISLKCLILA